MGLSHLVGPLQGRRAEIETDLAQVAGEIERLRVILADLDSERQQIDGLLARYTGGEARAKEAPQLAIPEATPPASQGRGLSDVIIDIVRLNPGIATSDLYDEAVAANVSQAADPRHSVANLTRRLRDDNRLVFVDGKYYPEGWRSPS